MLPRKRRVERKLFATVIKKSRLSSTAFFTVRLHIEEGKTSARAAVAVSKKIAPLAVDRNLIKRRINGILEGLNEKLKDSAVVLLFPKKGVLELPYSHLQKEVLSALTKAEALKAA